jgi:asparagine synthase (glutamine-hydrolysing)
MGALAALLSRVGPPDLAKARRMLEAAPHRGEELELREHGDAILGVSNRPDQVDSSLSRDGDLVSAFSGTLDNATELIRELEGGAHPPRSADPADIVVSAFREWGEHAPSRLRGVFASVVSDGRSVRCFRDQIGFRALHYRDSPESFYVASEAKQIVAGAGIPREPDLDAVERIFYGYGWEGEIASPLRGVYRLVAGASLAADRDGVHRPRSYWHPERVLETLSLTAEEAQLRFEELFGQAIARSLTGQDAVSLSGGIDSSAIAAFAAPQHLREWRRPLSALSAVFPDLPTVDERIYIEMIADYLEMPLHTYRPAARSLDDVAQWSALLDGPTPIVSVPELDENYSRASQLGFRNVLTGELAEFVIDQRAHVIGHLLTHRRWRALATLLATMRRRGAPKRFVMRQLMSPLVPGRIANTYLRARGMEPGLSLPPWIDRTAMDGFTVRPDLLPSARARWSERQLDAFSGASPTLAADEIISSMHGVTVRRPFVDVDLWEFFLGLRAEIKFPDLKRKSFVRSCLRGKLPDAVIDRQDKTGFGEHLLTHADLPTMRRFLVDPPEHRFHGVDYAQLAGRLERGDFTLFEFCWARDLTAAHAFLSQW